MKWLRAVGLFELVVLLSCGVRCLAQNGHCSANHHVSRDQTTPEPEKADSHISPPAPTPCPATNHTEQRGPGQVAVSHQPVRPSESPVGFDGQQAQQAVRPEPRSAFRNPQRKADAEQTDLPRSFQTPSQTKYRPQKHSHVQLALEAKEPFLKPTVRQEEVPVKFEERIHMPASSVAVRCGEAQVTVEVKQDFLGNGQMINASDMTLGGCAAHEISDHVLTFQTPLQECGSTLKMNDEVLIYTFALVYSPTAIGNTFILKTNPAVVPIRCHYPRKHEVSSAGIKPFWRPFAAPQQTQQQLLFTLRLMTDNWQSGRPSNVYSLGDMMNIEASVLQGYHIPLRVFADSCVATPNPGDITQPRYSFINNHGCLADSKMTGAKSFFMQREREDKLGFQLQTFRFPLQDIGAPLFISCHLKATTLSVPIDTQHKVCSFLMEAKRWVASGGDNLVCSCCESSCTHRRQRSLATNRGVLWEGDALLGPITIQNTVEVEELVQLSDFPLEQDSPRVRAVDAPPSDPSLVLPVALLSGVGAAVCLVGLVIMAAIIYRRVRGPGQRFVST